MKLIPFIVFCTIFSMQSFSQKKTVQKVSFELNQEADGLGFRYMSIGNDQKNNYYLAFSGVNLSGIPIGFKVKLNKYDADMNLIKSVVIPKKTPYYKLGMYREPINMKLIGGHLFQIAESKDKSTDKKSVTIIEYDKNSLTQTKHLTLGSFPYVDKQNVEVLDFIDKNNSKEFALLVVNPTKKDKLFIINEDLEISYQAELDIPNTKGLIIKRFLIEDDRICFSTIENDKKKKVDKTYAYVVDRKSNDVNKFELVLKDVASRISDFEYGMHGDKIHVSGFFYSEDGKNPGGTFSQFYSIESGEIESQSVKNFTFDFLTENMNQKQKEKAEKTKKKGKTIDDYEYLVTDVIVNEDGSSILCGERFKFYVTTTTSSNGTTRTTPHYIYADIIMMKTDKSGEILWVNRFKRFNHATNAYSGGTIRHSDDKNIYMVYIDENALKMSSFDRENGENKTEIVFSKDEIGKYMSTLGLFTKSDENTYKTQFQRLSKRRILTIKFPN